MGLSAGITSLMVDITGLTVDITSLPVQKSINRFPVYPYYMSCRVE
jgi:hypothetical protein